MSVNPAMTYLPEGVASESLRLAAEFQEATAQVAAIAATTTDEAKQIIAAFMDAVVKTSARPFSSYGAIDITEWWLKS